MVKRSRMLEIITYHMWNNHPVNDYKEMSEDILDRLESEGMLPPLNESVYHYMDNNDRQTVNAARPYFTWEKENE